MNALRSAYCRAFQLALRAALPFLPYRDPQVLKSVEDAARMLRERGLHRPLIVTDKGVHGLGLLDGLKEALEAEGLGFRVFDDVVPNPTIANVEAARVLYLQEGCDCLIAFGGGSSMDCAKATGARIARPNKPIPKMRGILKVLKKTPLLVAVPTTAGTGSETTLAAVITDGDTHYKYPINDFPLIPSYAVLDWRVTAGLPKHITATTGMDALVHATEAYIGRSTTKETRACAVEAVSLIRRYLKLAYDEPSNQEARQAMLHAANRAGLAFSKSYVGYVHGVAHSLGGQYGTPHGLANAVICPYVLEMYGPSCRSRLGELARKSGVAPQSSSDEEASRTFIQWFRQLNASMGIPEKLEGIREEDIASMACKADVECNPLYPVPMLMDATELQEIYRKVMA
ncbi:MAG: iron-containing alcohol dehydrogenase [Coriobacteriales bacterium]